MKTSLLSALLLPLAMTMTAMRKIRFSALLFPLPLLLIACLAQNQIPAESRLPTDAEIEQYNASVAPDERIVCRRELPVGTNIPKRLCRLVKDVEDTSQFHRDQLRRALH